MFRREYILTQVDAAPTIVRTGNGLPVLKPTSAILGEFDRTVSDVVRVPGMEATNKHELAIAKVVDRISTEDRLDLTVIPEVTAALDFMTSRSDSEFLVHYIKWRLTSPIAK